MARLRWNAVLFDLDGTLIDTRAGIRAALGATLLETTGHDGGTDLADLSLPLDAMIRSARPSTTQVDREAMSAAFRRHYDSDHWRTAEPYPGAMECLRDLTASGVRAFVITNKRRSAATRLLDHFQLSPYFTAVVGQPDAGMPFPKAELARRCIRDSGLDPQATVVVGNSDSDERMATSWAMPFIALASGAGPLSHATGASKRVELDTLTDVATFLLQQPFGRDQ